MATDNDQVPGSVKPVELRRVRLKTSGGTQRTFYEVRVISDAEPASGREISRKSPKGGRQGYFALHSSEGEVKLVSAKIVKEASQTVRKAIAEQASHTFVAGGRLSISDEELIADKIARITAELSAMSKRIERDYESAAVRDEQQSREFLDLLKPKSSAGNGA